MSVEADSGGTTRRGILTKTGTALLSAQPIVSVAKAATASGNVELQTTATVPTSTTVDITVFEDTDGSGSANNQQTASIADGTTTTEYDTLDAVAGDSDQLWLDVQLSTSDDTMTPSVDSATVTLPESDATPTDTDTPTDTPTETMTATATPREPIDTSPNDDLFEMLDNPLVFVALMVFGGAGLGLASGSLAIAAWGGYMIFAVFAVTSGIVFLENILYVTLVLIFIGFGFKFWRLEGSGGR